MNYKLLSYCWSDNSTSNILVKYDKISKDLYVLALYNRLDIVWLGHEKIGIRFAIGHCNFNIDCLNRDGCFINSTIDSKKYNKIETKYINIFSMFSDKIKSIEDYLKSKESIKGNRRNFRDFIPDDNNYVHKFYCSSYNGLILKREDDSYNLIEYSTKLEIIYYIYLFDSKEKIIDYLHKKYACTPDCDNVEIYSVEPSFVDRTIEWTDSIFNDHYFRPIRYKITT
jgi:hypothetical protein